MILISIVLSALFLILTILIISNLVSSHTKSLIFLSGSLGSQETSLLKMVRAYAMLSNLGYLVDSNLILSVQQRDNTYSYKSTKNIRFNMFDDQKIRYFKI